MSQMSGGFGAARGGAGVLERSGQLSALGGALAAVAASGPGRVVLVAGEAGVGKTALLRRFCAGVNGSARVLWAGCDPLFTPRPLGPVVDLAGVLGGEVAACAGDGARPYDVALALLRELEAGPSVLVLEDVHWADEATLDVIRLAGRRVGDVPALLVLSYRDDELERSHPLRIVLGDLPGSDRVTRLELAGLSPQAVAELAGRRASTPGSCTGGRRGTRSLSPRCWRRARGWCRARWRTRCWRGRRGWAGRRGRCWTRPR